MMFHIFIIIYFIRLSQYVRDRNSSNKKYKTYYYIEHLLYINIIIFVIFIMTTNPCHRKVITILVSTLWN